MIYTPTLEYLRAVNLNHSNQNEQTCYISTTFIPDGKPVLSALNLLIRNKINAALSLGFLRPA